jgi:ABC-2 type transport system permease protein
MSHAAIIQHIVGHEFRLIVRSPAAWVVCAALVSAVVCAAWSGTRWVHEQRATIARVEAGDERRYAEIYAQLDELERQGDPRPDLQLAGMAWYVFQPNGAVAPAPHIDPRRPEAAASEWLGARHALLPPKPLAALAIGQSDLHPYYTRVTIRTRPALVQSDEIESPANLLNGRFDLAFVLTFCWPLLVLPLLYNVLSEDREAGTLALVASQPVSLRAIVAARLAVRGGAAMLVTLVASLMALAVLDPTADLAPRDIAAWTAAILATGLFWCGVASMVNLARWSSAANATVLTAWWLAGVVIAPALIDHAASVFEPVPSRVELVNAVRNAGNLTSAQLTGLVSAYYEEHPDAIPSSQSADVTAIRGLAQQDAVDRRIDPILAAYRAATARQQALVDRLRYISPPLLVHDAVLELAGTSVGRYRRFAEQVDEYHRGWRAYFYALVHARARMTRPRYEDAPRFTFVEGPGYWRANGAVGLVAGVSLLGAAMLALVLWRHGEDSGEVTTGLSNDPTTGPIRRASPPQDRRASLATLEECTRRAQRQGAHRSR